MNLSLKGIIIAIILMAILDLVSGIALGIFLGGAAIDPKLTADQRAELLKAITQSPKFLWSGFALGSVSTIIGGYLTVRIAKRSAYFNAAAFGVAGVVLYFALGGESPRWYNFLAAVTTIPLALLGGHLARSHAVD